MNRGSKHWQTYADNSLWLWEHVQHIEKIGTAIDCGAHIGKWTKNWHDKVRNIEAFEPNPKMVPVFQKATEGIKNLHLHQVALGNKTGKVSMDYKKHSGAFESSEYVAHVGTFHVTNNNGPIEMHTLDSYNFTDVDIIKIDVEGYELPLLEGARETILSNKPWIQIEANNNSERYGITDQHITDKLLDYGLKLVAEKWPDQIWRF